MRRNREAVVLFREQRFAERHLPVIQAAEAYERAKEEAREIQRLTYLSREAYSHEERALAANRLDDVRRARLARLDGQLPPRQRVEQLEELRLRHLHAVTGIRSPAPVFA
jgi:hypothetical protein